MQPSIYAVGDNAVTISFGNVISPEINDMVFQLAACIESMPFNGFIELVPAYSALTVFYDVVAVRHSYPHAASAFEFVKCFIDNSLLNPTKQPACEPRKLAIPISFAPEDALDLELLAAQKNFTTHQIIDIFINRSYRVFMIGFLPAFSYMGEVDDRIATPRKATPRRLVPKGSVGIAGSQTGIYPMDSPGGWNIIGKTPMEMFRPGETPPSFLRAGDIVHFVRT